MNRQTRKVLELEIYGTVLIMAGVLLLAGCRESSVTEPVLSKKEILTSAPWNVERALVQGNTPADTTDITYQFSFVTVSFYDDGTFNATVISGTWELLDQENKLQLIDTSTSLQLTADILQLTTSRLQLSFQYPIEQQIVPLLVTFIAAPEAGTPRSPEVNFETLWREFDGRYSFFEVKGINWDSLYTVFRPQVTNLTTDQQLFQTMALMLDHLQDGHVNLSTPFGSYYFNSWYPWYSTNFLGLNVIASYFSTDYGTTASGAIRFGKIQNDLGYIYIGPALTGDPSVWSSGIDAVIDSLKDMRAIIVDLRNNGGGNEQLGLIVAGRFTDRTRTYSYVRWRNGTNHADFTPFEPHFVSPLGQRQFLNPVALLTNRRCFSSVEGTILMMKALPTVTVFGDTTRGGSANPIKLQLPNGWTYQVSRWIRYTAEQKIFEGVGLPPDIPVWISPADSAAGRDTILEEAINFLLR